MVATLNEKLTNDKIAMRTPGNDAPFWRHTQNGSPPHDAQLPKEGNELSTPFIHGFRKSHAVVCGLSHNQPAACFFFFNTSEAVRSLLSAPLAQETSTWQTWPYFLAWRNHGKEPAAPNAEGPARCSSKQQLQR